MDSGGADWRALAHAEQLLDLRRDTEAEQRFRDVLAGDPQCVPALLGLGRALNRQDRHDEAKAAVRSALALGPEHASAQHVLTDVLIDAGDGYAALESARQALRLDPTSFLSHYQHGRTLLLLPERRRWALPSAERAVEIDPGNADGLTLLGLCLAESGELDRAREAYRAALAIDPAHVWAQNNLAVVAASHGRLGRAARLLRSAAAEEPQESLLHSNLDGVVGALGERLVLVLLGAILLVAVVASLGVPWWTRALVGSTCLAVAGAMVLLLRRRLPRGFLAPTAFWRRSTRGRRTAAAVLVLLTVTVAFTALAPEAPLTVRPRDLVVPAVAVTAIAAVRLLSALRGPSEPS